MTFLAFLEILNELYHITTSFVWQDKTGFLWELDHHVNKFHIFRENNKILRNLHRRLDRYYIEQIYGGDFEKFWDLLRIYELQ